MDLLLKWLFHGTALTLLVALGVRVCGGMSAATRERVWWIAVIAVTLMPVGDILTEFARASHPAALLPDARAVPVLTIVTPSDFWTTVIVVVWSVWTLVSLARVAVALVGLERTKSSAARFPGDREARLQTWTAMRKRGRRVDLVVSPHAHRAAVFGLRRPVIAVAPDAIAQLTDDELDQIVVHEYAHVQRRDDLALLVQRLISAIAGPHPAVLWLNRALTIDREVACDDWVVTYTGARARYAGCLVKLASSTPNRWSVAPGASPSRSQLAIRVARLLEPTRNITVTPSKATLRIVAGAVAASLLISAAIPIVGLVPEGVGLVRGADQPTESRMMAATLLPITSPGVVAPAARVSFAQRQAPARVHHLAPNRSPTAAVPYQQPNEATVGLPLPATMLGQYDVSVGQAQLQAADDTTPVREARWAAVRRFGLAIGDGSRAAAVKTAGGFSRLGRSFATVF